jgi:hypothetical protein
VLVLSRSNSMNLWISDILSIGALPSPCPSNDAPHGAANWAP